MMNRCDLNSKFIYCIDSETAKVLAKSFKLIEHKEAKNLYIFANEPNSNFNFEKIDTSKYLFTNKLTF